MTDYLLDLCRLNIVLYVISNFVSSNIVQKHFVHFYYTLIITNIICLQKLSSRINTAASDRGTDRLRDRQ